MKNFKLIAIATIGLLLGAAGEKVEKASTFNIQEQVPFKVGEQITYRVHYGLMNAGVAKIEISEMANIGGKEVYHMVGTGESAGMVDWFFPTKDRYETYMDKRTLLPVKFVRDVNENGFIIKRNVRFNRTDNTALDLELKKDTVFSVPLQAQDIFSAFYFARALDVTNIQKGDIIHIPVFLDHEEFPFKIKFVKREKIKTSFGKIWCLKFVPVVQEGRVFKDEDDMHLWISDDRNHIPIRIQSELLVGSIKIDIKDYKGLSSPLKFD